MNITRMKFLPLVTLLATVYSGNAFSQTDLKATDDFEFGPIEIVKGTEPISKGRQMWMESDEYKESMAADKAASRREREAMSRHGFITASAESIDAHRQTVEEPGKSQMVDMYLTLAYDPAADDLGYEVVGVIPDPPLEDGKIHDTTTVLNHPTLGQIFIRERSIATEPRTHSKYIYAPEFDMRVKGNPALLSVLKSEDGRSGRTVLSILTDTQLLHISVGAAIMRGDKRYNDLMDVARRL